MKFDGVWSLQDFVTAARVDALEQVLQKAGRKPQHTW